MMVGWIIEVTKVGEREERGAAEAEQEESRAKRAAPRARRVAPEVRKVAPQAWWVAPKVASLVALAHVEWSRYAPGE